jgi:hypothetical protein
MFRDPKMLYYQTGYTFQWDILGRSSTSVPIQVFRFTDHCQTLPNGETSPVLVSQDWWFRIRDCFHNNRCECHGLRWFLMVEQSPAPGMVLTRNDWSAHDVSKEKWEYVPLDHFNENFASSYFPWIVTMDARTFQSSLG